MTCIIGADGSKAWWLDTYLLYFGCLSSKPRPYSYALYLRDIDERWPLPDAIAAEMETEQ